MKLTVRFWLRAFFFVLLIFITFLTLTPNPEQTQSGFALTRFLSSFLLGDAENADKIGHFLAYAALGAAGYATQFGWRGMRWPLTVVLAFYGVLLEGVQGLGGVRSMEILDALANGLGAVSGFMFGVIMERFVRAQEK